MTTKKQLETMELLSETEAYQIYELPFERDGLRIYGEFYLPKNTDSYPTVLIGHPFGSSYQWTASDAARFAEHGIAAYVFDFCGGSPNSKSDGAVTEMSVLTERDDMEAVLDGLRNCEFVDNENLFLMGESQGGFVAAMLAAKRPEDVKGLLLFYPALVIPDDARERYADMSQIPETSSIFGVSVGRIYYTDVFDMDPYAEISGYQKDVLIVHGDQDGIVPISYAERAAEEYASAELITIEGGGHGFYGEQFDTANDAAIRYIQEHTDGGADPAQ
ncbi:MAG: YqiA/YcfP family alpha/beta fold hydrolase [Eubacteriales bacterium]|nr:YqiA/YcfP family alpha/beta fold hydrolase [Eubacteriales bacterium]